MNWAKVLADESRRNSVFRLDDLARRYHISEVAARNALRRYESHGLVEHISNKVYINKLNQHFSPSDLVNVLRPESCISLSSALVDHGITTRKLPVLTCVTAGYPKTFRSLSATIVYRKISKELFWGFEQRRTLYQPYFIAEPEKALLDWIYLMRQEGLPIALEDVNLRLLNLQRLRAYAARFPGTVNAVVKDLLLDQIQAA